MATKLKQEESNNFNQHMKDSIQVLVQMYFSHVQHMNTVSGSFYMLNSEDTCGCGGFGAAQRQPTVTN